MPTFPKGHHAYLTRQRNAKTIANIARDTGGNITEAQDARRYGSTAGDERTLRGIPAIGRGVAGVSPGSRPDAIAYRD